MPVLSCVQTVCCITVVPLSLKGENPAAHYPVFVQMLGASKYWHRYMTWVSACTSAASAKFNGTRLSPVINFHDKPNRAKQTRQRSFRSFTVRTEDSPVPQQPSTIKTPDQATVKTRQTRHSCLLPAKGGSITCCSPISQATGLHCALRQFSEQSIITWNTYLA